MTELQASRPYPQLHHQLLQARWVAVTGVLLAVGMWLAPARVWANLLIASYFLLTLALGGAVFLALTSVCGATWHLRMRGIPQALARCVPTTGMILLLVLSMQTTQYGWRAQGHGDAGTFWFKEIWLTPTFWLVRSVSYVVLWSLMARLLVSRSQAVSPSQTSDANTSMVRASVWFLVLYAVSFSLASVDWLMALDPMWFSTIWGVYCFAGMMEATLAAMIILGLTRRATLGSTGEALQQQELHDLGQLLIGFACFWMYIWFCQYMLIWYTNLPEETSYVALRTRTAWGPVVLLSILLNWLIPFVFLLPKPAKRSRRIMIRVAVIVLFGRWIDLSLIVLPSVLGATPKFGLWELAAVIGVVSVGVLWIRSARIMVEHVPAAR